MDGFEQLEAEASEARADLEHAALGCHVQRSGEASGALEQVLGRLADYLESQVRLRNKVTSILIYPLVMFGFALVVVGVLVTVVLPQITELLASLGQELPFYTRWIIGISNFTRDFWWAMGIVGFALFFGLRAATRTARACRDLAQRRDARTTAAARIICSVPIYS